MPTCTIIIQSRLFDERYYITTICARAEKCETRPFVNGNNNIILSREKDKQQTTDTTTPVMTTVQWWNDGWNVTFSSTYNKTAKTNFYYPLYEAYNDMNNKKKKKKGNIFQFVFYRVIPHHVRTHAFFFFFRTYLGAPLLFSWRIAAHAPRVARLLSAFIGIPLNIHAYENCNILQRVYVTYTARHKRGLP